MKSKTIYALTFLTILLTAFEGFSGEKKREEFKPLPTELSCFGEVLSYWYVPTGDTLSFKVVIHPNIARSYNNFNSDLVDVYHGTYVELGENSKSHKVSIKTFHISWRPQYISIDGEHTPSVTLDLVREGSIIARGNVRFTNEEYPNLAFVTCR